MNTAADVDLDFSIFVRAEPERTFRAHGDRLRAKNLPDGFVGGLKLLLDAPSASGQRPVFLKLVHGAASYLGGGRISSGLNDGGGAAFA